MKTPQPETNLLPIRLFIHTPNNDIVTFPNIRPDAVVYELKSHLELRTGILAELQSLYMSNIKLDDRKTLTDERIKNGTVLRIKIKEQSLQQIYLASCKGVINDVFRLGVELMKDEELVDYEDFGGGGGDIVNQQLKAWNTFVPLRAFQALLATCYGGHVSLMVKLLERAAANVKMVTKNRHTALHIAAYHGHLACVSVLLSEGADSKLMDLEGMTALSFAALNGHVKVEKHLWLFNWNMDVLVGMEKRHQNVNGTISEQQQELLEMQETAKKYKNQYQSVKQKNRPTLPTILTDRLNVIKSTTTKEDDVGDEIRLPDIQQKQKQQTNVNKEYSKSTSTKHQNSSPHSVALIKLHERRVSKTPLITRNNPTKQTRTQLPTNEIVESKQRLNSNKTDPPQLNLTPNVNTERRSMVSDASLPSWSNGAPHIARTFTVNKPSTSAFIANSTQNIRADRERTVLPLKNISGPNEPLVEDSLEKVTNNIQNVRGHKDRPLLKMENSLELNNSNDGPKHKINKSIHLPPMEKDNRQLSYELMYLKNKKVSFIDIDHGKEEEDVDDKKNVRNIPRLATVTVDSVDLQDITRVKKRIIPTDRAKLKNLNQANPKRISIVACGNATVESGDCDNSKIISSVSQVNSMSRVESVQSISTKANRPSKAADCELSIPTILTDDIAAVSDVKEGKSPVTDNELVESNLLTPVFWQPGLSHQTESVKINGRFTKTFDEWLEKKNQERKSPIESNEKKDEDKTKRNETDTEKMAGNGRLERRKKAYEQWLYSKEKEFRKQKLLSKSLENSPQLITRSRTMSSDACSFEEWLKRKRELCPSQPTTPTPSLESEQKHGKSRERIRHGMTFEAWKAWKVKEKQRRIKEIAEDYENTFNTLQNEKRKEMSNATYEQWLRHKDEERRINMALRETLREQQEEAERSRRTEKYNDPHLKTFEEWLLEKDFSMKFENKTRNKNKTIEHHPEDANLIFDMWLGNKFSIEMSEERDKLTKLKSGRQFSSMESIRENDFVYSSDSDDFDSDSDE